MVELKLKNLLSINFFLLFLFLFLFFFIFLTKQIYLPGQNWVLTPPSNYVALITRKNVQSKSS